MSDAAQQELQEKVDALTAQLEAAQDEIQRMRCQHDDMEQQLIYTQKMATLGALVAGIAHEIKTPTGAISSMQDTLTRAVEKLKLSLDKACPGIVEQTKGLRIALRAIEEANRVIDSGSSRTLEIVRRIRKFASMDIDDQRETDIHCELDDTLMLIHHQLKERIQVVKQYGEVPLVTCNTGKVNQVLLNVLVNASQAIEGKGTITISTSVKGGHLVVEIQDSGSGIPPELLEKVFETGFTTKRAGVGTGLGLSICRQIMLDHDGGFELESEQGVGTKVTVSLPLD